jgi:AcrR family transcriptional regulator
MNIAKVGRVPRAVNARRYDATRRQAAAAHTRARILDAARRSFVADGYAATTMAAIAERAGVATDTIYATVGAKPTLFALLIETALSGEDVAIEGAERAYAVAMRKADTLPVKLTIYADAVAQIQQRLAPLFAVLRTAAQSTPELSALWQRISERRATNMRQLAADLRTTGDLRDDLGIDEIADVIWSMNGTEYYTLLVGERGWSVERYRTWLSDAWLRLLTR